MNITLSLTNATSNTMNNYDDDEEPAKDASAGGAGWFSFLRKNSSSNNCSLTGQQQATTRRNNKKVGPRRHSTMAMPSPSLQRPTSQEHEGKHKQQRSSSMIITRPNNPYNRRPSIPTSIYPLDLEGDMDIEMDRHSGHSYISECTMMTYSEERAEMIKKAFFQKIRESKIDILRLSMEQKEALLRKVQEEQDERFKREKKEKRKKILEQVGCRPEDDTVVESTPQRKVAGVLASTFGPLKQSFGSIVSLPPPRNNRDEKNQDNKNQGKNSKRRNRSCTLTTHNPDDNENHDNQEIVEGHEDTTEGAPPREAQEMTTTLHHQNGHIVWPQHEEFKESPTVAADEALSGSIKHRACIDDIIELKLLVANQQATIDTLSSKLHNLQLANRQRTADTSPRSRDLEERNRRSSEALAECRERDMLPRKESNSRHHHRARNSDDSNNGEDRRRSEGINGELARENAALRRALRELRGGTTRGPGAGGDGAPDGRSDVVRAATPASSEDGGDVSERTGSSREGGSRRSGATTTSTAISSADGDGGSITVRTL